MLCKECDGGISEKGRSCEGSATEKTNEKKVVQGAAEDNGVTRWLYEMNLWRNPTVVITVFKVIALAALAPGSLVMILDIAEGKGLFASLKSLAMTYGGILLVLSLLILPAYILIAVNSGGRYCVIFEMDAHGVRHTQLQKQYDKARAQGMITAFAGVLTGSPVSMGAGLLAASKQSTYSRFQNVRSVTVHQRRGIVYLTTKDLVHNQIYAEKDDFQSVVDSILNHVPRNTGIRYK